MDNLRLKGTIGADLHSLYILQMREKLSCKKKAISQLATAYIPISFNIDDKKQASINLPLLAHTS